MLALERITWRHWNMLFATLLLGLASVLHAQDAATDDADAAGDPPARVARVAYRSGDLGLMPAGTKEWSDASLNRPLTTGDRLSSGDHAKSELELGGGSVRMAANTDLGVLTLNDQLAQFELTQGTANVAVRQLDDGQTYEIDTPTVALVIDQPGTFRVDVAPDGKGTQVTVFRGRATVYGENNTQRQVISGTQYQFDDSSLNQVTLNDTQGGDAFDDWCNNRDERFAQSPSSRRVSEDVVGYQDLDQYGNWQADPDYGQVWYPSNVAGDWAPYRDGHWAYVAPWGWTWVDDSPWGFAPYHYGRWAYVRGAWGWVPGPIGVRPVYAPALVAFVGGSGWSVSLGIGGGAPVGWFPLGPGEIYNPWYHASRGYYTHVNVTNIYVRNRVTVINDINHHYDYYRRGQLPPNQRFINRDAPRGFSAMPGRDFAAARNVRGHLWQGDPRAADRAQVMPRGASVAPGRASFAPPRSPQARPLPAGGFDRTVVARHAPDSPAWHRPDNSNGNGPRFGQMPRQGGPVAAVPNNVHVIGQHDAAPPTGPSFRHGGEPGTDRPNAGMRDAAATLPNERMRPEPGNAQVNRDTRPNLDRAQSVQDRAVQDRDNGSLRSARFAHPNADERGAWRAGSDRAVQPAGDRAAGDRAAGDRAERPGVSFVSSPQQDRQRAAEQQVQQQPRGTLPDTPNFRREPQNTPQPRAIEQDRSPVADSRPEPANWRRADAERPNPSNAPRNEPRPDYQAQARPERNWQPQPRVQEQARVEQPRAEPRQSPPPQQQRQAPQPHNEGGQQHPRGDDHHGHNNKDDHT